MNISHVTCDLVHTKGKKGHLSPMSPTIRIWMLNEEREIKILNGGHKLQKDLKFTPSFHTALLNNPGSTF